MITATEKLIDIPANCVAAKSQIRQVLGKYISTGKPRWISTHRRFWQVQKQDWGSWMDYED